MSFNIKTPFVIATHIKKFTSLTSINNKSKAAGIGVVGGVLYYNNGTTQVQAASGGTPVQATATPLAVTRALHANRVICLNLAGGIAATLPAATGTGDKYTFVVQTTFTGDATIKVASASDYMIGTAVLFQDAGDTVVGFATANTGTVATETDTVDLFDTGNVTGGIKGAIVELIDIATAIWSVKYVSDAAGTEATPFKVTV